MQFNATKTLALFLFSTLIVYAQTWDGDIGNDWNTNNNWATNPAYPNSNTADVTFTDIAGSNLSPDVSTLVTVRDITFNSTTDVYTLSASVSPGITLSANSDITQSGAAAATITANMDIETNTIGIGGSGSGDLSISGNFVFAEGGINKNGTGTVILSGVNAYEGSTTINAGILEIRSASALGNPGYLTAGSTVVSGATLKLNQAGTLTITNENLAISGTGVSSAGAIDVDAGDWTISNASSHGTVTLSASSTVNINSGSSLTLQGVVSGGASNNFTKAGSGTLTLSGTNTYDGITAVSAGDLIINGNQSASNGNITITAGAFLSGTGTLGGNITSLGGSVSAGNGQWTTGTLTMDGSSADFSSGTYVWDISDLSGTVGVDWDLLDFTTAYNLGNLSGTPLSIYIQDNNNYIGPNGGTPGATYEIMRDVSGFNESYFSLDSNLINTVWTISESGGSLYLSYQVVPEPGTWVAIISISFFILFRFYKRKSLKT